MSSEDATALAMLRMGYAVDDPTDEHRCLHFRVRFSNVDAAAEAVRAIDSYNAFAGERVENALRMIDGLDGYSVTFDVGREGSPVLYVRVPGDRQEVAMTILREAAADEVDVENGYIRAWWD